MRLLSGDSGGLFLRFARMHSESTTPGPIAQPAKKHLKRKSLATEPVARLSKFIRMICASMKEAAGQKTYSSLGPLLLPRAA